MRMDAEKYALAGQTGFVRLRQFELPVIRHNWLEGKEARRTLMHLMPGWKFEVSSR